MTVPPDNSINISMNIASRNSTQGAIVVGRRTIAIAESSRDNAGKGVGFIKVCMSFVL